MEVNITGSRIELTESETQSLASLCEFFARTYMDSDVVSDEEVLLAVDIAEALNG